MQRSALASVSGAETDLTKLGADFDDDGGVLNLDATDAHASGRSGNVRNLTFSYRGSVDDRQTLLSCARETVQHKRGR